MPKHKEQTPTVRVATAVVTSPDDLTSPLFLQDMRDRAVHSTLSLDQDIARLEAALEQMQATLVFLKSQRHLSR